MQIRRGKCKHCGNALEGQKVETAKCQDAYDRSLYQSWR
jgi:hypothetical protein